jgi:coiled-coil domain-containing protein 12
LRRIKWRNYQPKDRKLIPSKDQNENNEPNPVQVHQENPIKKELRKYQNKELNILPRNNNWDVKKLLEPKLEKLRRRTQRAIVDFLREKLANMSESDDSANEGEEETT